MHKWIKPFFVNGLALIRRTPVNCNIKEKHKDTKTCPALDDDLLLSFVLNQSSFDEPNVKSNCLILRAWRRSQPKAQEGRFGEISAKAHFYINIIKMILFTSVHILLFVHTHTLLTMIFWNVSKWSNWILQNQYFSLALVEKLNDDDVMMTVTLNFPEL